MSQYRFQPKKFRRLNASYDWTYGLGLGLGIYFSETSIRLEIPFVSFEVVYYTKKQVEKYQRIAEYFASEAAELEDL